MCVILDERGRKTWFCYCSHSQLIEFIGKLEFTHERCSAASASLYIWVHCFNCMSHVNNKWHLFFCLSLFLSWFCFDELRASHFLGFKHVVIAYYSYCCWFAIKYVRIAQTSCKKCIALNIYWANGIPVIQIKHFLIVTQLIPFWTPPKDTHIENAKKIVVQISDLTHIPYKLLLSRA